MVSSKGLLVDTSKVAAIRDWPVPHTIAEIRSFHGLTSFYRWFVAHFSTIMAPVTECMKGARFAWTQQESEAFELIMDKLTSACIGSTKFFSDF